MKEMTMKVLDSPVWDGVETLSRDEMAALQTERLRSCVARVVANVPFYREKLGAAGVGPENLRSPEDLARLPFTFKQDLRDNYPYGLFAVPMDDVVRLHASSGTTGKMTVVGYTANDIAMWGDLAARALSIAGVERQDMIHNAYGYGLFTGGLGLHFGGERLGATVVPVSAGNTRRQVELAQDFGATVLCCTPSYSLLIAEQAAEYGADLGRLRLGVFGAEQGPFGTDSTLRRWGLGLAARGGGHAKKRAVVAVARKLAVLMHVLWVKQENYDPLHGLTETVSP